ncbi:hypothetical protein [Bosea sp. R86505]
MYFETASCLAKLATPGSADVRIPLATSSFATTNAAVRNGFPKTAALP